MIKRIFYLTAVLTITCFAWQCAHPVMPSGGPKDITPPEILSETPPNGSARFEGKKFVLTTNEFVILDNIQQAALISPPMKELPEFVTRGKSVQVRFKEQLKPNTTYSVYFGDAIVDLTEGNPFHNFTYIFSTGDFVDSLSLYGTVQNAQNLMPEEQVYVMLYKNDNDTIVFDSLPYFVPPYYVSKTDVNGRFSFQGLASDAYLIFALNDQNANFIYDQPGEAIAFIDSLVRPFYDPSRKQKKIQPADTLTENEETMLPIDTLQHRLDSIAEDSIFNEKFKGLSLFMFTQTDSTQRLLKAELLRRNTLRFSFSQPADDIRIIPQNFSPDSLWYLATYSTKKDTVIWYLKTLPVDTLKFLIKNQQDTLSTTEIRLDPDKTTGRARQNKKKDETKEPIDWSSNIKNGNLLLTAKPRITFNQPMMRFVGDSAVLTAGSDTILDPTFVYADSLNQVIEFPIEIHEETRYKIDYPDSSFMDWNGYFSKAINLSFTPKPLKDYGVFTLHLHPEHEQPYILQMINDKELVFRQIDFNHDTTVVLDFLTPGKYLFKIIFDDNNNHQWDPGYYPTKLQPEKVIYLNKEIQIRANWEVEEEWTF